MEEIFQDLGFGLGVAVVGLAGLLFTLSIVVGRCVLYYIVENASHTLVETAGYIPFLLFFFGVLALGLVFHIAQASDQGE